MPEMGNCKNIYNVEALEQLAERSSTKFAKATIQPRI